MGFFHADRSKDHHLGKLIAQRKTLVTICIEHRGQAFAHARVVRRRSRRTSLPMVVDCSDTSLVGILNNFHCEHCCLLCFLALVLDCDNNSCKDI